MSEIAKEDNLTQTMPKRPISPLTILIWAAIISLLALLGWGAGE